MSEIRIIFRDHTHCRVDSDDDGVIQDLVEYFTFDVPGAMFSPAFKKGHWDGKIRLYTPKKRLIYTGLKEEIKQWAADRDIKWDEDGFSPVEDVDISNLELRLKYITPFELRPYQVEAIQRALQHKRAVLVSPTGSGKSLIAYCLTRLISEPTLIIVPNVALVEQLEADFREYGFSDPIHKIFSGQPRIAANLVITTWQSIVKQSADWFSPFKAVIVDECHHAKAKSITSIMEKLPQVEHRFGLTGSLDESFTNHLVLTGLFGPIHQVTKTHELIEQKYLATLAIKALLLKYPKPITKHFKGVKYQDEIDWLCGNRKRNRFILDLAKTLKGNTLILYRYVEKHGKLLHDMAQEMNLQVPLYFTAGEVDKDDREAIRKIIDTHDDSITIASEGTFGEGVNIRRIHNIIFASPSKARIGVMQKIGRGLRRTEDKTKCTLYDLADDLSPTPKTLNYTYKHYLIRVKHYTEERFPFKQTKVPLYEL